MKLRIDLDAVHAHLCNALETERCSIRVYEQALPHAGPASQWLRWNAALDEARRIEHLLLGILRELALDPESENSQRRSVRTVGDALLRPLEQASSTRERETIARECVRIVEQRERANWELLGQVIASGSAPSPASSTKAANEATPGRSAPSVAPSWFDRAAQFRLRSRGAMLAEAV